MRSIIPARTGGYTILNKGQQIKIINPTGHQVVDTWAFPTQGQPSWMSMAQSRQKLGRLRPAVGDTFIDNRRQSILTLLEDTSDGMHDMLYPCCDKARYSEAGVKEHESCEANLRTALTQASWDKFQGKIDTQSPLSYLGTQMAVLGFNPDPLNLFMNVSVASAQSASENGSLDVKRPQCKEGAYIILKAEVDCIVVMSACPNDLLQTNGGKPGDAEFEIMDAA